VLFDIKSDKIIPQETTSVVGVTGRIKIKKAIRYFKSVLICVNLRLKNYWKMI